VSRPTPIRLRLPMVRRAADARRRRRRSTGQALAEFALILPVLAVAIIGTVDFARSYSTYMALVGGVREGALYLAQYGNRDDVYSEATYQARISGELAAAGASTGALTITAAGCTTLNSPTPTSWHSCPSGAPTRFVRARASYQLTMITPLVGPLTVTVQTVAPSVPEP
jgi:Flp pilus assembly protein TadG